MERTNFGSTPTGSRRQIPINIVVAGGAPGRRTLDNPDEAPRASQRVPISPIAPVPIRLVPKQKGKGERKHTEEHAERHRNKEKERHGAMNEMAQQIATILPKYNEPDCNKSRRLLLLQKIVAYVCFLEKNIRILLEELNMKQKECACNVLVRIPSVANEVKNTKNLNLATFQPVEFLNSYFELMNLNTVGFTFPMTLTPETAAEDEEDEDEVNAATECLPPAKKMKRSDVRTVVDADIHSPGSQVFYRFEDCSDSEEAAYKAATFIENLESPGTVDNFYGMLTALVEDIKAAEDDCVE